MDRNLSFLLVAGSLIVALRKESVDRNITIITICTASKVALRKESVDRNLQKTFLDPYGASRSPQGERG